MYETQLMVCIWKKFFNGVSNGSYMNVVLFPPPKEKTSL